MAYRLAIPIGVLSLYAIMAGLWLSGAHSAYFGALRMLGVEPFSFPFLDTHAVLAAAECGRQGIEVYLSNPCDALGRPHAYSPLWLAIVPGSLATSATGWVGASLDLLFLLSVTLVLRPRTAGELLILGAAAVSPMTVYALERANNDLVVFLLVIGGGILFTTPRPFRLFSYALFVAAGLLKYYPLVLLLLVVRERGRDALVVAAAAGFTLILFGVAFYPELKRALTSIPTASSYFTDAFSAWNLPFGFAEALAGRTMIAASLLSALSGLAVARTLRTVRLLGRAQLDWAADETQFLVIGGLLIAACFFAGQNIAYRGILLLPVLSGLVCLHRSVEDREVRRFFGQMIAAVLFVMWEECVRRALHAIISPGPAVPGEGLSTRAEVFFWIGRELVWWWLVVGLAALVFSFLRRSPFVKMFGRASLGPAPSRA